MKLKQDNSPPVTRAVRGELLLLSQKTDKKVAVELWLLNNAITANGWRYRNLEENKEKFSKTPILIAYVGSKIGDGHNFSEEKDPITGEVKPSFMDATAERIVGFFDKKEDIRIEEKDGKTWIVGKGYIWSWYAKELIAKLTEQGRKGMAISIETLVSNVKMENGVEVYDDYEILGTTILGDGVEPAVAQANIRILSMLGVDKVKELTLRVASKNTVENTKKSKKGEKKRMNMTELKAAFKDYKIVAVSGNHVVLLNSKNGLVLSSAEKNGEEVIVGKKEEISLNASVHTAEGEEISVSVDSIVAALESDMVALNNRAESAESARDTALKALEKMQKTEKERRINEIRKALLERLEKINAGCDVKIDESVCAEFTTDERLEEYAEMEDKEGKFTGLESAIKDLDSACMNKKIENAQTKLNASKKRYAWDLGNTEPASAGKGNEPEDVQARILD